MSSGENPESPCVSASTTLAHTLLAALWHCESRLDFWGHRNGKNARALLHGTTFAIISFTLNANTTQVLLLWSKSTLITAGNQMYDVFQGAPQHRVLNLSDIIEFGWRGFKAWSSGLHNPRSVRKSKLTSQSTQWSGTELLSDPHLPKVQPQCHTLTPRPLPKTTRSLQPVPPDYS